MKIVVFLFTAFVSIVAFADDHAAAPMAGEGAFVALMVQAKDPDAYIEMVKQNSAPFKALGSSVAGACVTKTGADYPGQMFIWNAFDSLEQAMAATDAYDPLDVPPELAAMRQVKYNVMFKPLKPFTLAPNSERLWRVKIAPANLGAFVSKMTELEAALRDAGHDINVGVFQPLGGGAHETIHLRAVSPSYAASGRVIDEAFTGAAWMSLWAEGMALVDEVVSDNFEHCQIIYTAS
ncbi:MAG: hypothetical protein P8M73_07170 [Luminiphilus sp.]|jgi:hypothetical protein|nr:hypothetical protein [Luminiphilus sp.]